MLGFETSMGRLLTEWWSNPRITFTRQMTINKEAEQYQYFVNSLREVLGLDKLYGEHIPIPDAERFYANYEIPKNRKIKTDNT